MQQELVSDGPRLAIAEIVFLALLSMVGAVEIGAFAWVAHNVLMGLGSN